MGEWTHDRARALLEVAVELAWRAGRLTLAYFQSGVSADLKSDGSPVTVADREAERLLRDELRARFPDHDIVGEEFGEHREGGGSCWWIDPIDGTQSFVRGVPLYGVLLGFEHQGVPRVGVAHFPALGETYAAASGLGTWWNGRRARVSSVATLDAALMAFAMPRASVESHQFRSLMSLKQATAVQRGWSDCYGHCLVATGRAELMLDPTVSPWDCAALVPIVSEAGGTFTSWDGVETIHGGHAVSTNGVVFDEVVRLLASAP